ncbi:glycogen/starch synthase [Candidatus Nanohalobium constans]|uniref:Glycogen synthase n=1 Tax=Candidatus Nanohalobium constans TaxID=2565781 RepID=A0A5Q0UGE7_9ARCH|nr:glycogen/starch synthase [Candidatus Nanohalobium constans]QGA80025.1 glycogen synthase [Candidatus Nanohalobium constans]
MVEPDNFIEVSFEAANKVGGIHQVLKSKACKMQDFYGDNYLTIGFYDEESAREEFASRENPHKEIFNELEQEGIKCRYGVWNIETTPNCILVDISDMEISADEIKEEMWEKHGIDSMNAGEDFDEPVKWSYAVGKLVDKLLAKKQGETVVQLHEWLSTPAMFNFDSPTVFTTHATVLGRALSNSDFDLLGAVEEGSVDDSLASEYGIGAKHQLEKAAADISDAFTTVSKTTGREAEAVLDQEPDQILPNGFNVESYPSLEELSYNHTKKKNEMKEFLSAYFKPYYDVNLEDDPRVLFISGRYEFHNKGVDILVDALSQLNKEEGDDFYVFIFVPSDTKGPKSEVLDNMSLYDELEDHVDDILPDIRSSILSSVTGDQNPSEVVEELLKSGTLNSLRRNFHEKQGSPPVAAFDLNYLDDEIMESLWNAGLTNDEEDRVKVIFYPTYLSVGDKLLSMSYNDAIVASSAGIFPSYYEPWGYTPVETAANGALSITTDLAGFGQFLQENTSEDERKGIKVLGRRNRSDEEAAGDLAEMIDDIVSYDKTEITERKHNARKLAQMTSWSKLGKNYKKAHQKAVRNHQ